MIDPVQARHAHHEREEFYRAVLALRRAGFRIYRAGRDDSVINGRRTPNALVIKEAEAVGPGNFHFVRQKSSL